MFEDDCPPRFPRTGLDVDQLTRLGDQLFRDEARGNHLLAKELFLVQGKSAMMQ